MDRVPFEHGSFFWGTFVHFWGSKGSMTKFQDFDSFQQPASLQTTRLKNQAHRQRVERSSTFDWRRSLVQPGEETVGFPHIFQEQHWLGCDTVDGRNPAPVGMVNIPLFTGF